MYVAPSKHTHSDKNITTREKFGTQVKKCLAYCKDNHKTIFTLDLLLHEIIKILKDFRKALDLLCIYEAMGLITRITSSKYIYTGFRGITSRLIEHQMDPKAQDSSLIPLFEEVVYEGKAISIKSSVIIGSFIANLFFEVIYLGGKITTKSKVEMAVEEFALRHKDINTKNLSQDIQNILIALNFIERNETTEILAYVGPQFTTFDKNFKKDPQLTLELLRAEDSYFNK